MNHNSIQASISLIVNPEAIINDFKPGVSYTGHIETFKFHNFYDLI